MNASNVIGGIFETSPRFEHVEGGECDLMTLLTTNTSLEATGKLIWDQTIKVDAELKQWLTSTSRETHGSPSRTAREAIVFFKTFHRRHKKYLRYKNAIDAMVDKLP